ncbi:MAG TPA: hypothetical protein PK511_11945 [Chitinophagales bacterium]|nr:hypothetical protein [Chitinophagales bacterium]HMX04957.1 hypothetical protein [Chitinophagales bacterium]HNE47231.1 hypothetical protein [Chitinophagales bacterium]HNI55228.1 hypothetical protein [Chitinophagales bacterium]HNJ90441.1 hypothetical protein [Chitinophagales bacterium]
MKKLFFLLAMSTQVLFGQNIGFNGAGLFENYDRDVEQYLVDLNQPFTIRFPGGSISKFHDPYNVRRGWGMSAENIKDWFQRTGFDEDGNGMEKWVRKAEEQPDHSYMDDLIAMQKRFPQMTVLWVLNVLNSTPEANMQAIRYLMNGGVHIVGVEAGNEIYGKYATFDEYIHDFEPIFKMMRAEYPDVKLALIAGANLNRKELVRWNDAMAQYKGDYDAVVLHYYYTSRELGEAYDMIPLRGKYDPEKPNKDLDKAYAKAADLLAKNDLLGNGIKYAKQQFKGKEIWITEWNTKPSDMLNNTILNGAWQFEQLITMRQQAEYLIIHNGVSPDKYGMISKTNKYDSEKGEMLKRIGYFAYMLAGEAGDAQKISPTEKNVISAPVNGVVRMYFTNTECNPFTPNIDLGKYKGADITINYVAGKHLYSGSGTTGYMGKGSVPSYEVKGITREKFSGSIPAYSFGYLEIRVK